MLARAMTPSLLLEQLADDFAAVVSTVDAEAEHDRCQAGIGPFEEERLIEMLQETLDVETSYSIGTEESYLDGGQRVGLFIESEKLRFRLSQSTSASGIATRTSTLLTDAQNHEAGFK